MSRLLLIVLEALYSSEPALIIDSISLISSDFFFFFLIWPLSDLMLLKLKKGKPFLHKCNKNQARRCSLCDFSTRFWTAFQPELCSEVLLPFPSKRAAVLLFDCFVFAGSGWQPACHCIQSPTKLLYHLILSSLAKYLYLEWISVLVLLYFKRGTVCSCVNLPMSNVIYLA